MRKLTLTALFVITRFLIAFSQEKTDSLIRPNAIKLDLVPFYHVFFDNRVQIRTGIEYERTLSKKSGIAVYLDIGLYDKYEFIKYYDFFSQNQGLYSIRQDVSIVGFHLLPSYNYYFHLFKKYPQERLFLSLVSDLGYYHKKTEQHNTLTSENQTTSFDQTKIGSGLGVGFKNQYGPHIFIELKTILIARLYNHLSANGQNSIKSLDAQWTSPNYKLWWISNIKIGYAF